MMGGVWVPSIRRATVAIGVLFYLSLELTMNLFVFEWLMIIILLTFLFHVEKNESVLEIDE